MVVREDKGFLSFKKVFLNKFLKDKKRNNALYSNIDATISVSEILKTTLGPFGLDKMLLDINNNFNISNDGATILKEMPILHPGAKILVDIARTQDEEVGDGTTSVILYCAEILKISKNLIKEGIHPNKIIRILNLINSKIEEIFLREKIDIFNSESKDKEKEFKNILENILLTAISGKITNSKKDEFKKILSILFDEILVNEDFIDYFKIKKFSGKFEDSKLISGLIVDKKPDILGNLSEETNNAKILVLNFPLEIKEPNADANVEINSAQEYKRFLELERNELIRMIEDIIRLKPSIVFCQKGIDPVVSNYLAKEGIYTVSRCKKSDIEMIVRSFNCNLYSTPEEISNLKEINDIVERISIKRFDNEFSVFLEDKKSKSKTFILMGSSRHFLGETERAIEDGVKDIISALKSKSILPGGGAIEVEIFKELKNYSKKIKRPQNKKIFRELSRFVLIVPNTIIENSGKKSKKTIQEIYSLHREGFNRSGIVNNKIKKDTISEGVVEPFNVKKYAILSSFEAAILILRVDDIIAVNEV